MLVYSGYSPDAHTSRQNFLHLSCGHADNELGSLLLAFFHLHCLISCWQMVWGNLREKRTTANVTTVSWTLVFPTACYLLAKHGHLSNRAACLNSESSFSHQERQTTNNSVLFIRWGKKTKHNHQSTTQKHSIGVILQMSGVNCFVVQNTMTEFQYKIMVLQKGVKKTKRKKSTKVVG